MIDVTPVTDDRTNSKLGKLDTMTIDSGPDLVGYVEAQPINGLAGIGLAVRHFIVIEHQLLTGPPRSGFILLTTIIGIRKPLIPHTTTLSIRT